MTPHADEIRYAPFDRRLARRMLAFLAPYRKAMAAALLLLALTASHPAGLLGGLFAVGIAASALSPAIQTRLMDVAGESQTLAAAANHSALNLGNSLGAFLGGAVIAAGWGYVAPTWLGLALCVPGVLLALAGGWLTHGESGRRRLPVVE